jgi:pimeloyl-ACP methyl ester carboxylesterase
MALFPQGPSFVPAHQSRSTAMNLIYIHGNRATSNSFNFIRSEITGHNDIVLNYDSHQGFHRNHVAMLRQLEGISDVFFIAHSLGGIHALRLVHALGKRVIGGVTLSTPYGGSEVAKMLACMLPFSQVLKDIQPRSIPIQSVIRIAINVPWTNLVSTAGGTPLIPVQNDGVVTLRSMRYRSDIQTVDIDCNHFEIVLNPHAVAVIQGEVENAQAILSRRIVFYA